MNCGGAGGPIGDRKGKGRGERLGGSRADLPSSRLGRSKALVSGPSPQVRAFVFPMGRSGLPSCHCYTHSIQCIARSLLRPEGKSR